MAQLAPYCKAYPIARFEEFAGWIPPAEPTPALAPSGTDEDDEAVIADYWFLQDTYVVTRGILPEEEIVFDRISPEWIAFCQTTLGFAVPDDLVDDTPAADAVNEV